MSNRLSNKPNPGSVFPEVKGIPDIDSFLTVMPINALASSIVTEFSKLAEIGETIQEELEAMNTAIEKRSRTIRKFADIPNPLPNVPDGVIGDGIDFDVPGPQNLVEGEDHDNDATFGLTLGENWIISEEDFE